MPFNDIVSSRWAPERYTTMLFLDWTPMFLLKTLWWKGPKNLYFSWFFDFQTPFFSSQKYGEFLRLIDVQRGLWKSNTMLLRVCVFILKKFYLLLNQKLSIPSFAQICDSPLRFMILERYITKRKSCNVPIVRDGYSFVLLLALKDFLLRSSHIQQTKKKRKASGQTISFD